jgi:hypothetical protein
MQARALVSLAVFVAVSTASPAAAQVELRPNLQPLPPVSPYLTPVSGGGLELVFGTLAWNSGAGPVEIRGGAVSGDQQEVFQRVYLVGGGFYDRAAGTFIYHPTHGHIHLEDYAIYTLDPVDVPVATPGVSSKTSFCLLDTQKIDGRLAGAPKRAVYTTCGSVVQGISVGWGDHYGPTLAGQAIDVTGFPAGTYRLSIEIDPLNQLLEIDDADNASAVRIYMDPAQLLVQVLGEDDPGAIVRIDSMVPAVMTKGETIAVVITGQGFDASLPVSFQGAGGAPTLSNLVFESGTTIRAQMTARSGGPSRTRVYDLHVGPAVLPEALAVLP